LSSIVHWEIHGMFALYAGWKSGSYRLHSTHHMVTMAPPSLSSIDTLSEEVLEKARKIAAPYLLDAMVYDIMSPSLYGRESGRGILTLSATISFSTWRYAP
jgi:hypothetical protein